MDGMMYYVSLAVVLVIAMQFFRGGHILLSFTTLAVGAWLVYSHEEGVNISDVKENIYHKIDEGAKSEYKKKRIETRLYDYNTSNVK